MDRVVALTLLAISLAPSYAAPQHPRLKKTAAAAAAHKSSVATRSSHAARTRTASARTRTRSGRVTRVVRVAPAPTYQLHPDPDRYQTIQKALAVRGYFKGDPNGAWGDDSSDAMRRFQLDQKIDNDGKIDALTLISLGLGPRHDGTTASEPRVPLASDNSSPVLLQPSTPIPAPVQPR